MTSADLAEPATPLDYLVIAAHPDDAELGVGGTILALKAQGARVGVLDLTNGEPTPHGSPEIRQRETDAASAILGLDWRGNLVEEPQEKLKLVTDNLRAPAPLPNRAFEQGPGGYRNDGDLDHILVRVDVTYLRQDFSALLPVEDAGPWPDFQRFDFVVRTRNLTESEAMALRKRLQPPQEGSLSQYHQAALFGLRELTGREATTPADWRRLLKLPLAAKSIGE